MELAFTSSGKTRFEQGYEDFIGSRYASSIAAAAPTAVKRNDTDEVTELRRCFGTDFDPVVVDALATAVSNTP